MSPKAKNTQTGLPQEILERVHLIQYNDFEELVKNVYGHNYEYVASEELGNDSFKLYQDISGKVKDYDEETLKKFEKSGEISYNANLLLEDLCRKGKIEPGHYLIEVSW